MSRFIGEDDRPMDAGEGKHGKARELAEAALRAEEAGDQQLADRLFAQAESTDPEAVENVLRDSLDRPTRLHGKRKALRDSDFGNDEAVAAMTRTVEPHSDSPDRAGITQAGSGADNESR